VRALRNILVLACAIAALGAPGSAQAGSSLYVGAVENAPLQTDLVTAKAKFDLARLAGFDTLRLAVFWAPGRASVMPDWDKQTLDNAAAAAELSGIRLMASVSNLNSLTTPNTPALQEELAIYTLTIARAYPTITDFIIGNEPNLNTFWMPQFAKPQYKTVTTKVRFRSGPVVYFRSVRLPSCRSHSIGNCWRRSSSSRLAGCRPSRIASIRVGESRVRRKTRPR